MLSAANVCGGDGRAISRIVAIELLQHAVLHKFLGGLAVVFPVLLHQLPSQGIKFNVGKFNRNFHLLPSTSPRPLNVCGGELVFRDSRRSIDRRPANGLQRHATRHGSQKLGFVDGFEEKALATKAEVGRWLRRRNARMNPAAFDTTNIRAFIGHARVALKRSGCA